MQCKIEIKYSDIMIELKCLPGTKSKLRVGSSGEYSCFPAIRRAKRLLRALNKARLQIDHTIRKRIDNALTFGHFYVYSALIY